MINQNYSVKTSLRLMVVDDNVDAAESLSELLELEGHNLQTAHDGFEAIRYAAGFKPQVAFLDIAMPGLNGYETAEELRRVPGLENIIIVALTGWYAEAERIRSTKTGFNYHLIKPAHIEQITSLLSELNVAAQ